MNTFCIPIKVENESDLYERFLPSGLSFSGELMAYLEDYLEDRKLGENVSLELQAPQMPDMEHFCSTFHTFVEKLIQRNKREIRLADGKAILFLILGIIFVGIGLVLAGRVDTIGAEIISAVGSFAMWSVASTFIETLPTLRLEQHVCNYSRERKSIIKPYKYKNTSPGKSGEEQQPAAMSSITEGCCLSFILPGLHRVVGRQALKRQRPVLKKSGGIISN